MTLFWIPSYPAKKTWDAQNAKSDGMTEEENKDK
jgi:hypothetical protein